MSDANDGLPEKLGTVVGVAISAAVYILLAWTVLRGLI
jgi:hypothetical protein